MNMSSSSRPRGIRIYKQTRSPLQATSMFKTQEHMPTTPANLPLQGLMHLHKYPPTELYRLFVDGMFHKEQKGWKGYEDREPGSLTACFKGLSIAIKHIEDKTLNIDLIKEIHKACTTKVSGELNATVTPGNFRVRTAKSLQTKFSIPKERATVAGLTELLNIIEDQKNYHKEYYGSVIGTPGAGFTPVDLDTSIEWHTIAKRREQYGLHTNEQLAKKIHEEMATNLEKHSVSKKILIYCAPDELDIPTRMQAITDSYNKAIREAKTEDAKMTVIANHIKQFELLHPFHDANGRVFANILLSTMLMQNGFPPATFYEPNLFDAYSTAELVGIIKEAVSNTQKLTQGQQLFDFDTKDMPDADRKQFQSIVQEFCQDVNDTVSKLTSEVKKDDTQRHLSSPNQ